MRKWFFGKQGEHFIEDTRIKWFCCLKGGLFREDPRIKWFCCLKGGLFREDPMIKWFIGKKVSIIERIELLSAGMGGYGVRGSDRGLEAG